MQREFSREFFVQAGRKGGTATFKKKGKKYMKNLSVKGLEARRKKLKDKAK